MKSLDNTKRIVLAIGTVMALASLVAAISAMDLMPYFFPLYSGLALMGTTLLHKEEKRAMEPERH
jgi:hypothetical protein